MTAILWLLKSMSEHVITMVDEETNKISSNLYSLSNCPPPERRYISFFQLVKLPPSATCTDPILSG